jgi:hypothetical protein
MSRVTFELDVRQKRLQNNSHFAAFWVFKNLKHIFSRYCQSMAPANAAFLY